MSALSDPKTGDNAGATIQGAAAVVPAEPLQATLDPRSGLESFAGALALWQARGSELRWPCLFALPPWLRAWWQVFGSGEPRLLAIRHTERTIGLAALTLQGENARFMGAEDVCDHLDLALAPRQAATVAEGLCRYLRTQQAVSLEVACLRPDSLLASELIPALRALGCAVRLEPAGVSLELELPASWEAYLDRLDGKQRHELRRKLRHLDQAGSWRFELLTQREATDAGMRRFLELFHANRADKAAFMDARMQRYFELLAEALSAHGLLRLGCLEIEGQVAAMTLAMEYRQRLCLYNNAYDGRFAPFSVGLLSKALTLRAGIERGVRCFDFLKGSEPYKYRLGGRPVELQRCHVTLAPAPHGALLPPSPGLSQP